jgi:hypothetical protein
VERETLEFDVVIVGGGPSGPPGNSRRTGRIETVNVLVVEGDRVTADFLVRGLKELGRAVAVDGPDGLTLLSTLRETGATTPASFLIAMGNIEGRVTELKPTQFKLLEFLLRHAGRLVTRAMLPEGVWEFHPGYMIDAPA